MDQVYSFNLKKGETLTVNPRTGNAGVLELHPVKGIAFLFRGALDKSDAEAALGGKQSNFTIAANANGPGVIAYDGNQSEFTVFANEDTIGYVRISESCSCKK